MTLALAELPRRERCERAMVEVGLTPARYVGRLMELLEDPQAEAEYPALVRRLRRLAAKRAAARCTYTHPGSFDLPQPPPPT